MNPRRYLLASLALGFPAWLAALTFSDWQTASFTTAQLSDATISGATADPEGDGASNLHEYAFFGEPLTPNANIAPTLEAVAGTLTLTYHERQGMTDASIGLQGSDTLINWITYNTVTEADREAFTGYDEVTLLDPVAFTASRRFLRLRVELLPVPALRAPIQLTLAATPPTTRILGWTDPNTTETGYAIERQNLSTGAWDRLATTAADTSGWTHASANPQAGASYRVVALGANNAEVASAPVSIPDSDGNGLVDVWEIQHFGRIGIDPNSDLDADGKTNRQELAAGTDPNDFFDAEVPVLRSISGERQSRVSGFLPQPVVIQVYHADGQTPWVSASVTLSVDSGAGQWASVLGGAPSPSIDLRSDANGRITAYYWMP